MSIQDKNNISFQQIASPDVVEKTQEALKEHNFIPMYVSNKEEALAKITELVPAGASVMNGASETLREIGYLDFVKSDKHSWNNLHAAIAAEKDPQKQAVLRKQALLADYYLGSAHAVTETGEILVASNTGSQLPHLVYTSPNAILVVGAQKIVSTLSDGLRRIEEYVVPREDKRMTALLGVGTTYSKTVILHRENPKMGRRIYVIIVDEKLGF